jgi:ribosomal protein S18 acetylase RimI-like enzyme
MSGGSAPPVKRAVAGDLPGIVVCDDRAQHDRSRLQSIEASVERGECLVAWCEGSVGGFVVLERTFFGHSFIPLICVKASHRRKGLGLRLLAAAEKQCHTAKLFTSTNASNTAARSLFERAGFVPSGTIENLDANDPEMLYFKPRATD